MRSNPWRRNWLPTSRQPCCPEWGVRRARGRKWPRHVQKGVWHRRVLGISWVWAACWLCPLRYFTFFRFAAGRCLVSRLRSTLLFNNNHLLRNRALPHTKSRDSIAMRCPDLESRAAGEECRFWSRGHLPLRRRTASPDNGRILGCLGRLVPLPPPGSLQLESD